MKKVAAFSFIVVFLLLVVFACGSTKTCPAYSKNNTEQSDNHNS